MTDDLTHRVAIVLPTYNNAGTLVEVLDRVLTLRLDAAVVVVNDGSTDDTADRLAARQQRPPRAGWAMVTHPRNRGKAAALVSGFAEARRSGATHAVTIDTDLQHDPEDIPGLLTVSRNAPDALVVGARSADLPGTPLRSRIGRSLSNLGVRVAGGVCVSDSQSGLRVYPLALVESAGCRSSRYGFETEIIIRAAWLGRPVLEAPITSRYLPPGQRVSHFRPCLDSLRCLTMHARMLASRATGAARRADTTPIG